MHGHREPCMLGAGGTALADLSSACSGRGMRYAPSAPIAHPDRLDRRHTTLFRPRSSAVSHRAAPLQCRAELVVVAGRSPNGRGRMRSWRVARVSGEALSPSVDSIQAQQRALDVAALDE